jgi:hypothetical protein
MNNKVTKKQNLKSSEMITDNTIMPNTIQNYNKKVINKNFKKNKPVKPKEEKKEKKGKKNCVIF